MAFFTGRESSTTTSVASSAMTEFGSDRPPKKTSLTSLRRMAYIAAMAASAAA